MLTIPVPKIKIAQTAEDIERSFPVMVQLRPHLKQEEFVQRVLRQQKAFDYTLAALEEDSRVVSLAGFRISECLFYGRYLYVDDLVTDASCRSKGYGKVLLDWLVQHAREKGCQSFTLDSGVQRFEAHRFYLVNRMNIDCHHFALKL